MKNLVKIVTLLVAILISANGYSQKSKTFQGVITYDITFEGEVDANTKAFMPTQMIISLKENKSRMELISAMKQIILNDKESMTQTIIMDIMGQKMAIQTTKEEFEKQMTELPELKIEETEETKEIAGYTCKKVKVTDEEGNITVLYYTEDIDYENPNWNTQFKNINGMLMEYSTTTQNEVTMTFTVKSVSKQKVKNSLFEIPSDYKIMTAEEAKDMFGG